MNVRYRVELSQIERTELRALLSGGKHASRKLKRAQILLAADGGAGDEEIARSVGVGGSTVYRTKRRFLEGNLERALSEEPRPGTERKLTGKEEALLVATGCTSPPKGRARWTLDLLAGAMVKLTEHKSLSHETVRRRPAENGLKPWRKDMWCIPQVDGEYVARMEDVLDLYAEAPDPKRPVVCFDESPLIRPAVAGWLPSGKNTVHPVVHREENPVALKLGYLLPTREQVMDGRPEAAPLLSLAERAEGLGNDSIWVGDSLLARPRHEPLTLLAAVAGRTHRVQLGTAVLLPALRNPVVLAHVVATLDQVSAGRLILGVGIGLNVPSVHSEFQAAGVPFERFVGRMLEGLRLCRALWTGQSVNWDGRWQVEGGVLAPTPHRAGGPAIWVGGNLQSSRRQVGRSFDGWLPITPNPEAWAEQWAEVASIAREAGRDPANLMIDVFDTFTR